jgi:hypothetical protein
VLTILPGEFAGVLGVELVMHRLGIVIVYQLECFAGAEVLVVLKNLLVG